MLYEHVVKPILFNYDPEKVHDFFTNTGESLGKYSLTRAVTGALYNYHGKDIGKGVNGIHYQTPFLLSAGFDYNGHLSQILPSIGLGGEEIGSVTARPCEGNPAPRLTRLPKSQSILVNKGLRNDGVDAIIERLKSKPRIPGFVLGISIARTNDEKSVLLQAGIDDYTYSLRRLTEENVGDYYTINISCPNAFGGEAFTNADALNKLLSSLSTVSCAKPIYVKMPINIPWKNFSELLDVMDKHYIQGVVIGNLNKNYSSLEVPTEIPNSEDGNYKGGLSGKPCTHPSTALIQKTRELYGKRFTIIGVGGVMSPETALEKFEAGADLVQLITGIIYKGPGLVKKLCKAYAKAYSKTYPDAPREAMQTK